MRTYHDYVHALTRALAEARDLPLGTAEPVERPPLAPDAPRIAIISPHPDDELIIGALALRFLRQCGCRVVNIAVTLGSNKARQAARQEELQAACRYIGFETVTADQCGLEGINLQMRREQPARWIHSVDSVAGLLREIAPVAVFYPHVSDANSTHIGVHWLLSHALLRLGQGFACECFETEFWSPMDTPNLMVESSADDVAALIAALSFHKGEVSRNPYHLTLPAWMMDNVRRGAERVAGQGQAAPAYSFATLYRHRVWDGGRFHERPGGRFCAATDDPADLLG